MDQFILNGQDYITLLDYGYRNLALDCDRINALNVFPVPDGDTGSNMKTTISGGVSAGKSNSNTSIGAVSKSIARSMVLSARGNSGVILSQFFKGLSMGLENYDEVNVIQFAEAMISGTKKAYSVVSNPTEGTILTVMREAGEKSIDLINAQSTLEEYLEKYLVEAKASLERTPDLLPVLKKAGVIDSGGAGFVLIIEGMIKAIQGKELEVKEEAIAKPVSNAGNGSFNADSVLTYGYCTEVILQLQNCKVNIASFDESIVLNFLKQIGDSIVCFKDDDLIKVHVHTKDPGLVLSELRKFGEFLTIKIENMNVQHSENSEFFEGMDLESSPKKEHKKYATVAVANGNGLCQAFKKIGVDEVVSGGQTMNTSTADFIEAFNKIDADNILVFPNNSNIKMAAKMAADNYDHANVYVLPTYSIAEGYSAISMLNFDSDNINEILAEEEEAIKHVNTLEVTYSIRDAVINDIDIKKGDFICIYNGDLISADADRLTAIEKAFDRIPGFDDMQVMSTFAGKDVNDEDYQKLSNLAQNKNSFIECFLVHGDQDVYSYIIGLE